MTNKLKTMLTALLISTGMTVSAQTADNMALNATWALTTGTGTENAVLTPDNANDFFKTAGMSLGSNIKVDYESGKDYATSTVATTSDGYTQTYFKPTGKETSANDGNAITFTLDPKTGIAFTPTKVGLKIARWLTDKCSVDITWMNGDGTTKSLATNIKPNRDKNPSGGDETCSILEYDLTGNKASEDACALRINVYNMGSNKTVSIGDVFIEGTVNGTVGQAIMYSLTLSASPDEGGTVSVSPAGTSFESGDIVTLSQTTNPDYRFLGWYDAGDNLISVASPYQLTMDGDKVITGKFASMEDLMKGDYVIIPSGDVNAFREAIKNANKNTSGARQYIFLENGTYDYGTYHNPESGFTPYGRDTIFVDNVSIIGESTEGVIIQIEPEQASVSRTSPIVIKGTGTYLQNLTLKNNYAYGGNEGQAAALQDEGHHTIGKEICLTSNQDTYYSHTDTGQLYFEDSEFQGTVDFICGNGDVYFNRCNLVALNRKPSQGSYQGDTHIAAPYTKVQSFDAPGGHGYIFNNCHIDCKARTWDYGRGWRGWPKLAYLNSVLSPDAVLRVGNDQTGGKPIDYSLRVTVKGIKNSNDSFAMQFYEYNTTDEQGNVVSPSSNQLTFTAYDSQTYETILQPNETARFELANVYTDWAPDQDCRQIGMTSVSLSGNTLTWTSSEQAKAYLIENNGSYVTIVDGTESSFDLTGYQGGNYTVRAANMMGGFGKPLEVNGVPDSIKALDLSSEKHSDGSIYNIMGQKVSTPTQGIYIINGKKVAFK